MEYLGHSNIIISHNYLKVALKIALGCVTALEVKIQTFGMAERNGGCILGCGIILSTFLWKTSLFLASHNLVLIPKHRITEV